jgi:L-fuconolactonase
MLKLDSHQHFWIFDPVRDEWIREDMREIRRDFLPEHLKPLLDENNIVGCLVVQADQSDAETEFLLGLADQHHFIKGVVGWVDLLSPHISEMLDKYGSYAKLKGFRHIVQAEQSGFMLRPEFLRGVTSLTKYGYTFDILVRSEQMEEADELVKLHPEQKFVVDHLGKPDIRRHEIVSWSRDVRKLATNPNVYCKLSGMVTEADHQTWSRDDIYPFIDVVVNSFGPRRLMFGSDWPVCNLAAGYREVYEVVSTYVERLSRAEQQMIWADTAAQFYNLDLS